MTNYASVSACCPHCASANIVVHIVRSDVRVVTSLQGLRHSSRAGTTFIEEHTIAIAYYHSYSLLQQL